MAELDASTTSTARIRDDHAKIFRLVASVEGSLGAAAPSDEWLNTLMRRLLELGELLAPHFRFERDADMYDDGSPRAAHLTVEIQKLEREHHEFLKEIGAILALARGALDPDLELVKRLTARTSALFEAMRHHESQENELLMRAFGEDLGAGD